MANPIMERKIVGVKSPEEGRLAGDAVGGAKNFAGVAVGVVVGRTVAITGVVGVGVGATDGVGVGVWIVPD